MVRTSTACPCKTCAQRLPKHRAGEGYYLGQLLARLQAVGVCPAAFGLDVSKIAVRMAAGRHKGARFAVASSYRLPFDDQVGLLQPADPTISEGLCAALHVCNVDEMGCTGVTEPDMAVCLYTFHRQSPHRR